MREVAAASGKSVDLVRHRASQLHESNPMLGHRGCRLGITYPEIYEMQARAIFEAAVAVGKETGDPVVPAVMIPLIGMPKELELLKEVVDRVAKEVQTASGVQLDYPVGTMTELPRAAPPARATARPAGCLS